MGGASQVIEAETLTELKEKAQAWTKKARDMGMDIRSGWDRDQVVKTKTGYRITLWAHT